VYLPPVLRPIATGGAFTPTVQRIEEVPFCVVRGVPGSYIAERLAGVIDSWQRLSDCVWLRADGSSPADLAQSLVVACQHRWSAVETATSPSRSPDRSPPLSDAIQQAPDGAVIVLELGGRLTTGVARLIMTIRPAITNRGVRLVVVAESRLHPPAGHRPDWVVQASDLLDRGALAEYSSARNQARLIRYADHRAAVIGDVLAAAQLWSPDAVDEAVENSFGTRSLLGRLTRVLLSELTPDQRSALKVAASTGYWHPQMGTRPIASEQLRPWLVPLEQQWGWVRPIWVPSLRRELARTTGSGQASPGSRPEDHRNSVAPGEAVLRTWPGAWTTTRHGVIQARLLGSLEVRVDGSPVSSWNGQRGVSVLRYLLSRRQHACSRDQLLEEFWPDVPVAAARNRLQVAISGLRRAFLDVTALNIVEYADGGYRINPVLLVEVDAESFVRALHSAAAAERAGDREAARTAYRQATALYRGDFAADAPYEQWTLLPRESLRLKLVDSLDRLSRIELADRRIDDCIATAHRMLDVDPCREDAHRLLMRCYASQGRPYQALRQYEFCQRILRVTIDASPARDTTVLYHAIRSGST
jgi:DNA-binding SARP family transcriptional activator